MSSRVNTYELAYLQMILANVVGAPLTTIGSGFAATGTAGSLYLALHTASFLEDAAPDQTDAEVAYTGYSRFTLARAPATWTFATTAGVSTAKNTAQILMANATGGSVVARYASIGVAASGATDLLYWAQLPSDISIVTGVTPTIDATKLVIEAR